MTKNTWEMPGYGGCRMAWKAELREVADCDRCGAEDVTCLDFDVGCGEYGTSICTVCLADLVKIPSEDES